VTAATLAGETFHYCYVSIVSIIWFLKFHSIKYSAWQFYASRMYVCAYICADNHVRTCTTFRQDFLDFRFSDRLILSDCVSVKLGEWCFMYSNWNSPGPFFEVVFGFHHPWKKRKKKAACDHPGGGCHRSILDCSGRRHVSCTHCYAYASVSGWLRDESQKLLGKFSGTKSSLFVVKTGFESRIV